MRVAPRETCPAVEAVDALAATAAGIGCLGLAVVLAGRRSSRTVPDPEAARASG